MCCTDFSSLKDKVECEVKETADGVQITITPKDKTKADSLKKFFAAGKDLSNCC